MSKYDYDFRQAGSLIRLGQRILAVSYNTIQTERLKNTHSPSNRLRTAWPMVVIEFSDLVEGLALESRKFYTAEEIKAANEICDIYSKLPYDRVEKKLTLIRARSGKKWRELADIFKLDWEHCRKISDTVTLHLIQSAALDKHRHTAMSKRKSRQGINFIK